MTRPATIALEAAGPRISKRIPRDVYHLVASRRIKIGYIFCSPGEALCGTPAELQPCPDGLFSPSVTCPRCSVIAAREHITVGGTESQL